ncbi:protoheme IX farnesyltransferase [bacterium]|jgi:protoheme IX farnesyltransferase|nr:protoheme IX farnesyltransferase [bacterium]MBT3795821.1 protoheme IX farnesyltransferase [bacterium]MBT4634382.1 protoheme IX farnesyltransferase [bacterium]
MKYLKAVISLSKPSIILSVGLTGFTGIVLAHSGIPSFQITLLSLLCLILSAAGSAMVNNLIERKNDELMERLEDRVKALKLVGIKNLSMIAAFLITISLALSAIYINLLNCALILLAILSYTVYYTLFLKKSSPFGTVLGGIPGALPVIIGYSSIQPEVSMGYMDIIVLFLFMMVWQPPHFWALAQHLRDDYKKGGFPTMPIVYGQEFTNYLIMIYSLALLPISLYFWIVGICSNFYGIMAIILGLSFLYLVFLSFKEKKHYKSVFLFSILYMLLINIFISVDIIFL